MDDGAPSDAQDEGLQDRLRRLRWRLSGAWALPTFGVATVAGAIVIDVLPIVGQSTNFVAAFLFCGFANLLILGVLAPGAGWVLRRRRPALPRAVATDRAGTALMLGLLVGFLALGLAHRDAVLAADDADALQLRAARAFVTRTGEGQYVSNIGNESVWKQSDELYRTCVPGDDPRKHLCVYVDLSGAHPLVRRDADQQPNSVVAGPDNPGRRGG